MARSSKTKSKAAVEENLEADAQEASRYRIDVESTGQGSRSISLIIADRRCYQCQQGEDFAEAANQEPEDLIEQIAGHCATLNDYVLPDTPLKEAVFRLIVAGRNEPVTAAGLSSELNERWAMSAYPRNVSREVVQRLLDNGSDYGIVQMAVK